MNVTTLCNISKILNLSLIRNNKYHYNGIIYLFIWRDCVLGTPVSGYKILLQLMATQIPSVTVSNVSKYISLRNSYQNRQIIGTSILWVLGQGGFKDLSIGLKGI